MPEIEVVKTVSGDLRGFGIAHDQAYKRFKAWLKRLGPGEFFKLSYTKPRNYKFHKKMFALLNLAFEAWEPERGRKRLTYKGKPIEKDFEQFRKDIIIRAGFYTAKYDAKGRVTLDAQSISFDKMNDDTFARLYEAVLTVVLHDVMTNYNRDDLERVVAQLQEFGS